MISDLVVGHPFSARGIRDHRSVAPLMWSEEEEEGRGRGGSAALAPKHLGSLPPCPRWRMEQSTARLSDRLLHLPHTERTPVTFVILFYRWRALSFPLTPHHSFLLASLAGRSRFNCIVYDRPELDTNSLQAVDSYFVVSFHLTHWCVVVTHLTKNIQGEGLGFREPEWGMNQDQTHQCTWKHLQGWLFFVLFPVTL